MSYLKIDHIKIKGMAACVPERVEENRDYSLMSKEEIEKYIAVTGVERRHCAIHDGSICTSDLCLKAGEKLIADLGWNKEDIGLLVFVSQTTDYRLPATACVLQDRMGLPKSCMAFDVTLGCSGFMLGLGIIGSLLKGGTIKKALLMVGNTQSEFACKEDKSMYLLIGDAGTVTALEYAETNYDTIDLSYLTDGSGKDFLIVPDGGSRNPTNANSFVLEDFGAGIKRTRLHEKMVGDEVFSFATHCVPQCFKSLQEHIDIDADKVDYYLIHQANKFLCEKLRKKFKATPEKTPYNIKEFGNTSGATIPLLMVTELKDVLGTRPLNMVMTGFGVGLSIGVGYLQMTGEQVIVPELLYL